MMEKNKKKKQEQLNDLSQMYIHLQVLTIYMQKLSSSTPFLCTSYLSKLQMASKLHTLASFPAEFLS